MQSAASSSAATVSSSAMSAAVANAGEAPSCPYCANLKLLREILPPKRCDYCRQWRCQFCTLKFPLMGVRKVLPKVMKGNTRICLQCFNHYWHQNGLVPGGARPPAHLSKHVSLPEFGERRRRESLLRDSMLRDSFLDSNRRDSMLVDSVWASGAESLTDSSRSRLSFLDEKTATAPTSAPVSLPEQPPAAPTANATSLSRRVASFMGLVVADDASGNGLISAVDLWMSLFSASILVVIALADGLSLQQRVCYCVATYGLFLTLHPWIHADRSSQRVSKVAFEPVEAQSDPSKAENTTGPTSANGSVQAGVRPLTAAYKAKKDEIEQTVAYYLSDGCPWKKVRSSDTCVIYEMTNNKTNCPLLKLETFVTGISKADFMAFVSSKNPQDRAVWDVNMADFEVIERFDCDDADEVSVCVNKQKSFLGGLVAPRDFCMLYIGRKDSIVFTSVEHPKVPPRDGTVRGHLYLTVLMCKDSKNAQGVPGFTVTYMGHADIRGSLPPKLLYKGTLDNQENVMKVFRDAGQLFRTAPLA